MGMGVELIFDLDVSFWKNDFLDQTRFPGLAQSIESDLTCKTKPKSTTTTTTTNSNFNEEIIELIGLKLGSKDQEEASSDFSIDLAYLQAESHNYIFNVSLLVSENLMKEPDSKIRLVVNSAIFSMLDVHFKTASFSRLEFSINSQNLSCSIQRLKLTPGVIQDVNCQSQELVSLDLNISMAVYDNLDCKYQISVQGGNGDGSEGGQQPEDGQNTGNSENQDEVRQKILYSITGIF